MKFQSLYCTLTFCQPNTGREGSEPYNLILILRTASNATESKRSFPEDCLIFASLTVPSRLINAATSIDSLGLFLQAPIQDTPRPFELLIQGAVNQ